MYQTIQRPCAAVLSLLALCAGPVYADDGARSRTIATATSTPAAAVAPARTDAAITAAAETDKSAAKPAAAGGAPSAKKAVPPPRRPDTPGWRRIMAGAGRT